MKLKHFTVNYLKLIHRATTVNPIIAGIFTNFRLFWNIIMEIRGSIVRGVTIVTEFDDYKKVKFSGRDNSPLVVQVLKKQFIYY